MLRVTIGPIGQFGWSSKQEFTTQDSFVKQSRDKRKFSRELFILVFCKMFVGYADDQKKRIMRKCREE